MYINTLDLENFRCFDNFRLDLNQKSQFTLLIGDNGKGKTALLDALAVGMGSFFLGIPEASTRSIEQEDVRGTEREIHHQAELRIHYPAVIRCEGVVDGQKTSWERSLRSAGGRTTSREAGDIKTIAENMRRETRDGKHRSLPVLAYFGTARLWVEERKRKEDKRRVGDRFDGYVDSLEPRSNQKQLETWFAHQALVEFQEGTELPHLEGVRQAVLDCMPEVTRFYYRAKRKALYIDIEGESKPFWMLSDGYRNMLAMVANIAWRAVVLNPHLGADAPKLTEGVVLIDEIDLHLHPKWQRRIVEDLRKAFPKLQFIATTHSPFIIQSMLEGELRNLDKPDGAEPHAYVGGSPEDIVEDVQGVKMPQRSKRWQKMFNVATQYYEKLDSIKDPETSDAELKALRRQLDALKKPFSDDPAFAALLEMERLSAEAERT